MEPPCSASFSSPYQEALLSCLCWAWGLASVLACMSILWSWFRMANRPKLTDASSMIIFLTLSDLCLGLNAVIEGSTAGNPGSYSTDSRAALGACQVSGLCVFKACVAEFFGLSSFLWSAAMSHSSYKQVTQIFLSFTRSHLLTQQQGKANDALDSNTWTMLQYHMLCWGVPFFSTCVMLATRSAGPSGSHFCWVATDLQDNASFLPLSLATVLYLLPLLVVEAYHLVVFRFLAKTLGQIPASGMLLRKFTRVLAILIGSKTVLLLARALRLFVPANTNFAIGVFSVLGAPLQGLCDYLVFKDGPRDGGADLPYESVRGGGGGGGAGGGSSTSSSSISSSSGGGGAGLLRRPALSSSAVVGGMGVGMASLSGGGSSGSGSGSGAAKDGGRRLEIELATTHYSPIVAAAFSEADADADVDAEASRSRHASTASLLGGGSEHA